MGSIEEMAAMFGAGVAAQLQDWEAQYGEDGGGATAPSAAAAAAVESSPCAAADEGERGNGANGGWARGRGGKRDGNDGKGRGRGKRRGRQQQSPGQGQGTPQKKRFRATESTAALYSPAWLEDPWLPLTRQKESSSLNGRASGDSHGRESANEGPGRELTQDELKARELQFAEHQRHLQKMHEARSRGHGGHATQRPRTNNMHGTHNVPTMKKAPLYSPQWLQDPWEELTAKRGTSSRNETSGNRGQRPRPPPASQLPTLPMSLHGMGPPLAGIGRGMQAMPSFGGPMGASGPMARMAGMPVGTAPQSMLRGQPSMAPSGMPFIPTQHQQQPFVAPGVAFGAHPPTFHVHSQQQRPSMWQPLHLHQPQHHAHTQPRMPPSMSQPLPQPQLQSQGPPGPPGPQQQQAPLPFSRPARLPFQLPPPKHG